MSERNGTMSPSNPGTKPIAIGEPAKPAKPAAGPSAPAPASTTSSAADDAPLQVPSAPDGGEDAPVGQPTAPVSVRPRPRLPRRGPLTVMGPWAPVAGGLVGLLLGVVAVLFLAGTAESFEDRLALTFAVLGLAMLGTAGTLLADEVRLIRQRSRDAGVRPQWVESTADLVNGLTPARLLLAVSAFVLFLAAFVSRG